MIMHTALWWQRQSTNQGLYLLSGKTSYPKISWSLEAARFGFKLFQSLWNLAGTSAALLPRCLSNFRAIQPLQHPISRLRDFTRFGGKTPYRLVNRGPDVNLTKGTQYPFPTDEVWSVCCEKKSRYNNIALKILLTMLSPIKFDGYLNGRSRATS